MLFAARMAGRDTSEVALTRDVLSALGKGMICLADRNLFGDPPRRIALMADTSAASNER